MPAQKHNLGAAGHNSSNPQYFLIKNEPEDYSLDDLINEKDGIGPYDGIRNFRARNTLKEMKVGDQIFFYHSSCKVPAIVGIAELAREAYPDPHSWDPKSKYFDAQSSLDNPRWFMIDMKFVRRMKREISLTELKQHSTGALQDMPLVRIPRLSVQRVTPQQWDFILSLEETPAPAQAGTAASKKRKGASKQAPGKDEQLDEAAGPQAAAPAAVSKRRRNAESDSKAAAGTTSSTGVARSRNGKAGSKQAKEPSKENTLDRKQTTTGSKSKRRR